MPASLRHRSMESRSADRDHPTFAEGRSRSKRRPKALGSSLSRRSPAAEDWSVP